MGTQLMEHLRQRNNSKLKTQSQEQEELLTTKRYKISKKIVVTKDIHWGYTLVYNLRCGTIRRCSSTFWKALSFENRWGGYVAWRPKLRDLVKDKFLVPLEVDEQEETLQDKIHSMENNMTSQLYCSIWPTANCNLACDYCGQKHSNTKLSRKHCDMVVQFIQRRLKVHGFKKLHVSWFGAEPLLGLDVMRYLTPRFFKIAKELGIKYDCRVVTNGTLLTKDIGCELINQMGVVWIEVTIDGPREIHDRRRFTKQGKGTYERIIQNITDFSEIHRKRSKSRRAANLTLRCNVDFRNANAIKQLVDELASLDFQKEVGRITFAAIFPWGKASGQRYRYRKQKKFAKINLEAAEYAISKGFKNTWYLPLGSGTGCQASGMDTTLNVVPGGRLYRCGEIPLVPQYEEQHDYRWWDKGTLEQMFDQNEEDITFFSDWYAELLQGKWPCTKCKFFGVCAGQCPKQWRDGYNLCPIYVFNFSERMRLYSRLKLPVPDNAKKGHPLRLSTVIRRIRSRSVE